jgi:hypothetical protein
VRIATKNETIDRYFFASRAFVGQSRSNFVQRETPLRVSVPRILAPVLGMNLVEISNLI